MRQIVYTLTLSVAMLASSALATDKPGGGKNKHCEDACEQKKEQCERLKPGSDDFKRCMADAEQQCKQACKEDDDDQDTD